MAAMVCPNCGKDVPGDMKLCGYCGKPLAKLPESEQEIWRGAYSGLAMTHEWILWALVAAALSVARFMFAPAETLYTWILLGAIGLSFVALLFRLIYRKLTIRYRLTSERFFRTRGILFQTIDELDLHRVDDFEVRQNFFQKIVGVGTIHISAPTDPSHPSILVAGIADPVGVKEKIRTHVSRLRKGAFRMEQI